MGHAYITAPKNICEQLKTWNGMEYRGKNLILVDAIARTPNKGETLLADKTNIESKENKRSNEKIPIQVIDKEDNVTKTSSIDTLNESSFIKSSSRNDIKNPFLQHLLDENKNKNNLINVLTSKLNDKVHPIELPPDTGYKSNAELFLNKASVSLSNITHRKPRNQKNLKHSPFKGDPLIENDNAHYMYDKSYHEIDNTGTNNKSSNKRKEKKKTLILGDSIVKDIDGWKLNGRVNSKVAVKSILVATTKGMVHHAKGCITDFRPNDLIIHHGTNDLSNKSTPEEVASNIINLAKNLKSEVDNVYVSGLTIRNDKLEPKVKELNNLIETYCYEENIKFINNNNVTKKMLNHSNLHLNSIGTKQLVNNICKNFIN